MLTKPQWLILNSLADADMPLEAVYRHFVGGDLSQDPAAILPVLFNLFGMGLVTFRQEPIRPIGQDFASKSIEPQRPEDILGDRTAAFEEFRTHRDYLWRMPHGEDARSTGVPFGIWIDMTPAGRAEWDRPDYSAYYDE